MTNPHSRAAELGTGSGWGRNETARPLWLPQLDQRRFHSERPCSSGRRDSAPPTYGQENILNSSYSTKNAPF